MNREDSWCCPVCGGCETHVDYVVTCGDCGRSTSLFKQDEIAVLKAEIARLSKSPLKLIENHEPLKDRPILLCNLDDGFSVVAEWENHYSLWRGAGQMRWPSGHFTHWCELPAPLDQRSAPPAEGEKEGGQ